MAAISSFPPREPTGRRKRWLWRHDKSGGAMSWYLLKTEPSVYSFADLQKDKKTVWDGVTSPAAVKHMREMKTPAHLIIYHTGSQKSAVGTATAVSVDPSDPKNPRLEIEVGKPLSK